MAPDTKETNKKIEEFYHSKKAIAKVMKAGMVLPSLPEIPEQYRDENGAFKMPEDITALSAQELGQLYSLLTGLSTYYESIVALYDIDCITAESVKEYTEAQVLTEINDDPEIKKQYTNVTDRKALLNLDERVQKVRDWYNQALANYKLAHAIHKGFEKYLNLVSREITRRSNLAFHENRLESLK